MPMRLGHPTKDLVEIMSKVPKRVMYVQWYAIISI